LTLHDFWLNCPRGQRITEDGTVCTTIDRERCVTCLNPQWDGIHRDFLAAPRRMLLNLMQGKERAREELRAFDRHMREVLSRVDRFVSPSKSMLADFVAYGVDPKKAVRLRYCLDGELGVSKEQRKANGQSRSRAREEGGKLRIGYLGTLIPTKGVHVLTEAYRSLKDLPVTLDIHGTSPPYRGRQDYVGQLEKSVRDVGGVRFRGPYEQSALPEILKGLDVVVVPSVWMENFPQTALEALSAGVPVVAADHGGLAEIVRTGVNGLKFRPGDPVDLARKLRQLVDDPGLHKRLCGRGIDIPRPEEHAEAHIGLYREVIREKAEKTARAQP
jgi:glycosyltransferase involved in cell wall biosynthesis